MIATFPGFTDDASLTSGGAVRCSIDPQQDECVLDRDRFEALALEHLDAMFRMAMQLARHPDEASDLVQEAYLKAFRVVDRYEERGGGMRPWLFKILHNVFYSSLSKARRQPISVEDFPSAESRETGPGEPPPAWNLAQLDWEHVDDRLCEAIAKLRPEYSSVLLMWGVEQMKYREIAEIQGIPIGTVMSRLHRARSILAEQLAEFAEELGIREGYDE
jgi:RNA polymerase sigma-70 factor (ECF subfamily)